MENIKFKCPFCSQSMEAPADMASEYVDCPSCEKQIRIPSPFSSEEDDISFDPWKAEAKKTKSSKRCFFILMCISFFLYGGTRTSFFTGQSIPGIPALLLLSLSFVSSKYMNSLCTQRHQRVLCYIFIPVVIAAISLIVAYLTRYELAVPPR